MLLFQVTLSAGICGNASWAVGFIPRPRRREPGDEPTVVGEEDPELGEPTVVGDELTWANVRQAIAKHHVLLLSTDMHGHLVEFVSKMRWSVRVVVGALDGHFTDNGDGDDKVTVSLQPNFLLVMGPVAKVTTQTLPRQPRNNPGDVRVTPWLRLDVERTLQPPIPLAQMLPRQDKDRTKNWTVLRGVVCKAFAPANLRSEAIASGRGCSTLAARSNNVIRTAARFQSALPASFMAHSKVVARHEWSLSNQWQHGAARLFYESLRGSKRRTNRARWASLFNRRRADARYRRSTLQAWRRYSAG